MSPAYGIESEAASDERASNAWLIRVAKQTQIDGRAHHPGREPALEADPPQKPAEGEIAMNEPVKNKVLLVHMSADDLWAIVQEAVKSALRSAPKEDHLLTVEKVAEILNVTPEWIYHNTKKLPFTRKVGGMLRFSSNGLQRYIESAKFTVKGS
jgi:hypothetical protein